MPRKLKKDVVDVVKTNLVVSGGIAATSGISGGGYKASAGVSKIAGKMPLASNIVASGNVLRLTQKINPYKKKKKR